MPTKWTSTLSLAIAISAICGSVIGCFGGAYYSGEIFNRWEKLSDPPVTFVELLGAGRQAIYTRGADDKIYMSSDFGNYGDELLIKRGHWAEIALSTKEISAINESLDQCGIGIEDFVSRAPLNKHACASSIFDQFGMSMTIIENEYILDSTGKVWWRERVSDSDTLFSEMSRASCLGSSILPLLTALIIWLFKVQAHQRAKVISHPKRSERDSL